MSAPDQAVAIFEDLEAEQDALDVVLAGLSPDDWSTPSAARGWTVADVVLHLAQTEELVVAAADGEGPRLVSEDAGLSVDDLVGRMVAAERGATADVLLERWRVARRAALRTLRDSPPGVRLPWVAMPLSPATLATTRLAEHWAHALDITGPLGLPYVDTGRLRHVAWLAMRTLPYALALTGQRAGAVRCGLTGPDGDEWRIGPDDAPSAITGAVGSFCRVAAQRLRPEDSGLTATGPDGAAALRVVRTYAA